MGLERTLHLPGEGSVQGALLHSDIVVHLANTYYATVHFPATVAFLVWMYLRRPVHYGAAAAGLLAAVTAALALHLTFPLAPPRLLAAAGLVDTGQVYGPTVYRRIQRPTRWRTSSRRCPRCTSAGPTVAIGLIAATRSRLRWLWLLHPLLTLLVIVGTANHYWLDAVVATALLGIALAVIRLPRGAGATEAHGLVADEALTSRRSSRQFAGPAPAKRNPYRSCGQDDERHTRRLVVLSLLGVAYAAAAVAQERLASRTTDSGMLRLLGSGAWWWTVVPNASAALLHVAALKYGTLTLVQPLGALTLVAAVPRRRSPDGGSARSSRRGTALTLYRTVRAAGHGVRARALSDHVLSVPAAGAGRGRHDGRPDRHPVAARHSTGPRHATASGFASGVASALTQTVTVAVTAPLGAAQRPGDRGGPARRRLRRGGLLRRRPPTGWPRAPGSPS